jgi:hypothetical protein
MGGRVGERAVTAKCASAQFQTYLEPAVLAEPAGSLYAGGP